MRSPAAQSAAAWRGGARRGPPDCRIGRQAAFCAHHGQPGELSACAKLNQLLLDGVQAVGDLPHRASLDLQPFGLELDLTSAEPALQVFLVLLPALECFLGYRAAPFSALVACRRTSARSRSSAARPSRRPPSPSTKSRSPLARQVDPETFGSRLAGRSAWRSRPLDRFAQRRVGAEKRPLRRSSARPLRDLLTFPFSPALRLASSAPPPLPA